MRNISCLWNKILNVYFNPKLSHNRKGTLEHTKASKQRHYLHREHVFRSYVIETKSWCWGITIFSSNLHFTKFEELLKRFTELVILLQILKALLNQDCGTLADFDFLNTNCLLFAKYEEVGWYKNIVFEISCKCFFKSMKLPWVTVTNHIWQASASVVECAIKQSNESWQMSWMDVAIDFCN